ncbi:MAG: dimethyl sulfoxide reductase anchor subunit [Coriobacteriales bacterium]|jgi:anaerobic dimethyl sulfoxide reductase subunit C (anchor subunit)|nr:dimethyl sulfoxide reductase anchor subunit [Coriobacteriales bacterium]
MEIQWPLVLFSLLAGTGAGTLVFIGISELTNTAAKARGIAAWVAAGLIVVGGLASIAHLGKPDHVMNAVSNLGSFSGISIELIFIGVSFVVAVIYAVLVRREGSEAARKAVGVIAAVIGLLFCWALGSSYVIASRPLWAVQTLPLSYFGSGLASGGFLFLALAAAFKSEAAELKKLGLFALIVAAIELIAFVAYGALSGAPAIADNALLFWGGAVVVGAVVPVISGYLIYRNAEKTTLVYAGLVGALVGGVAFRALMWVLGSGYLSSFFDVAANSRGLYPF